MPASATPELASSARRPATSPPQVPPTAPAPGGEPSISHKLDVPGEPRIFISDANGNVVTLSVAHYCAREIVGLIHSGTSGFARYEGDAS